MKRPVPVLLIIIGLLLTVYPTAKDIYFTYQQRKLIADWQESMLNIGDYSSIVATSRLNRSESEPLRNKQKIEEAVPKTVDIQQLEKEKQEREWQEKEEARRKADYIKSNMEGMLEIDRIKLLVPILSEATSNNLNISVSSIVNTGKAGQEGNYCIAGHNSKYYGKNFNRLNEVEIGDSVKVNDGTREYKYIVSEKFLVKPQEIWVLEGSETDKEITLITCDKVYNSTHRLIIKGKMEE